VVLQLYVGCVCVVGLSVDGFFPSPAAGLSHWLAPSLTTNSSSGDAELLLLPLTGMLVDNHFPGADVTCAQQTAGRWGHVRAVTLLLGGIQ
jgi:hypothetical protein